MSQRFEWKIKRMAKKIKQSEIAKYLNCSQTLVSFYENEKMDMDQSKVRQYKQFIEEYQEEIK